MKQLLVLVLFIYTDIDRNYHGKDNRDIHSWDMDEDIRRIARMIRSARYERSQM
jgi:hypothetical protein